MRRVRDVEATIRYMRWVRQTNGGLLRQAAQLMELDFPWQQQDDGVFEAIAANDAYKAMRPYLAAFQAAEARVTYLLFGSPVTADALMAADQAARMASDEARSRVYQAALKAGLEEAERVALGEGGDGQ